MSESEITPEMVLAAEDARQVPLEELAADEKEATGSVRVPFRPLVERWHSASLGTTISRAITYREVASDQAFMAVSRFGAWMIEEAA